MTIKPEKVGRNLHLLVEGIEAPFVIRPLPGRAGVQITDTYLESMSGRVSPKEFTDALVIAVDGGVLDSFGRWVPVPEDQQTNYARIGNELSQAEAETIIMPAFFWQTLLGFDGVKAYIEGGEGLPGTLKAAGALTARLGRLTPRTSPHTA